MITTLSNTRGAYAGEAPLANRQANLDAVLAQAKQGSGNMSQLDWIRIQRQLDEYNRDVTFQSTVIKVVGESIKSILRNIG